MSNITQLIKLKNLKQTFINSIKQYPNCSRYYYLYFWF